MDEAILMSLSDDNVAIKEYWLLRIGISAVYRIGLSTLPWGTPDLTAWSADVSSLNLT